MASASSTGKRWWSQDTVAVVTGGNKGIGYEIVKSLALNGVTVILTARDDCRGFEAVQSLNKTHNLTNVHFHKLDVTTSSSIAEFANWLKSTFGSLDILVNNAGIAGFIPGHSKTPVEIAKAVIQTNYYGVRMVTEQLIPLMKPSPQGARIINISSGSSRLDNVQNESLRKKFSDIDNLTFDKVDELVGMYLDDVEKGQVSEKGWSGFFGNYHYCVSKAILNAYTRVLAAALKGQKVYVNCMCPGLCSTDMTSKTGHPPEVGAETAVWLALSECPYPSGKFFIKKTEVGFDQIPFHKNNVLAYSLEEFKACTKGELPDPSEEDHANLPK